MRKLKPYQKEELKRKAELFKNFKHTIESSLMEIAIKLQPKHWKKKGKNWIKMTNNRADRRALKYKSNMMKQAHQIILLKKQWFRRYA